MLDRRNFCALCAAGVVATLAVAGGAAPAQAQAQALTRKVLRRTELPGTNYVTVLVAVDIAPGAVVARHTHPGIESGYVLDGEGDLFVAGEADRQVGAGDSFHIPPEIPHGARNRSADKPLRVVATYVVDKDKPLASPAS